MKIVTIVSLLALVSAVFAQEASFVAYSVTEKDLFPSAIVSTATVDWNGDEEGAEDKKTEDDPKLKKGEIAVYGHEHGWVGAEFEGLKKGDEVTVTISGDGFLKPSTWTGTILRNHTDVVRIFPKAVWDYDVLGKNIQQRPANLTIKVTVNDDELEEQNETVLLRSINDCPFFVLYDENGEEFDDFSWLFAAYVNENHPGLDSILKDALAAAKAGELIDSFTGYQSGEPETTDLQVFAIWNALQRRGIQYSDISTTTPSKWVYTQTVRFLDDSIAAKQANCVDGSVLMASLLTKIGIKTHLVMVPGHCFLAYERAPIDWEKVESVQDALKEGLLIGLETTMLGSAEQKDVKALAQMSTKLKEKEFLKSSETFGAALEAGVTTMVENIEGLDSGEDPVTQLISVADARELGIMPLASDAKAK
jgi:hypothetical protein